MYDEIVCELDFLPKPFPSFIKEGHQFQTKSLDCCLETFHINKQKRLTCNGKDLNYHGNLNFYTSNIRGCGHGFYFTSKGEPYEDVDYCKYGMSYRKRTRLWNNIYFWQPHPLCKRDCLSMNPQRTRHLEKAQQTLKTTDLYKIPAELVKEILTACDLEASTASEGSNPESD